MVSSITNLSRSGLLDWMVQRVTAVVLGSYALFMFAYFLFASDLDYQQWQGLFAALWFKIYTLAALLALVGHIWVGMWTIVTDYVKNAGLRFMVLAAIALTNFVYFVIGFAAVWGA
ncbi:succinate dehydrogenase, hydrophobic membrane anchor protein [Reinekea sp.]|jgi:succinate dehydrogenase / fumarate reductase membrane anchor subunit|uniref:succinate dehydrogenase, hydrophobic membrane anchor protein n=1 Tax=Reinekea sp. TaxID=1970455 RepID=UPI002A807B5A|nr:succinate dehydrogenase, hydrophobic membrane anchor protein [Reinekea sp.]